MARGLIGAWVVPLLAQVAAAGPVCPKQLVAGPHTAIPLGGDAMAIAREGAALTVLPTPRAFTITAGRRVRIQGPGAGLVYLSRETVIEPGLVGGVGAALSVIRLDDGVAVVESVLGSAPSIQISCANVSSQRRSPRKPLADNAWIERTMTLLDAAGEPTSSHLFGGPLRLLGRKGTLAHVSWQLAQPGLRLDGWLPADAVATGKKLPPRLDALIPATLVGGEACPDVEVSAGAVLHAGAADDAGVATLAVTARGNLLRTQGAFELVRVRRPDPDLASLEGWVKAGAVKRVPCSWVGSGGLQTP